MRFPTSLTLTALVGAASLLPATAGTLRVPQQYPTIQKAVTAAKPGDTVLIAAKPNGGVYNEGVTVTTPNLTLQGKNNPVIDGTGLGVLVPQPPPFQPYVAVPNGIEIEASHVAVRGLVIQNFTGNSFSSPSAVNVGYVSADGQTDYSFSDIEVSGCTVKNNAQGVIISGYAGQSPYYGGGGGYLKNYKLLNNTITGSGGTGASVSGVDVLVTGNHVTGSGGDGLDVAGDGLTVTANECAANGYGSYNYGLSVSCSSYNPAAGTKAHPNPDPTTVTLNSIHDNTGAGAYISGTQLVTGNVVDRNTDYGLYLDYTDYSVVSANVITRTTADYAPGDDISSDYGDGLYVADSGVVFVLFKGYSQGGPMTISLNKVSGNAGDGIALNYTSGVQVTANSVTGNGQVGIHTSDFDYYEGFAPNVISYNTALHNTLFDAQDDATGVYGAYQDGNATTPNVWTHNTFGTTDPVGLSK